MNIGNALTQINPNTLQGLIRGMHLLVEGKRNNMKTSALDVLMFIANQIGSENFMQLLNYSLSEDDVKAVIKALESHRQQKNKGVPLADALKQHKLEKMARQNPQWNQQNIR